MELPRLNFKKTFDFKFRQNKDKLFIFGVLRKSYLVLTPEEWVRQHWIHYFLSEGKAPSSLLTEKKVEINGMPKRFDLVVLDKTDPAILIECKAPQIKLLPEHFEQAARYNMILKAPQIIVSNGLHHIFADYENEEYRFFPHEV